MNTARLDRQTNHRQAGVTLIELMVVIIVISIVSAVMIPQFRGTFDSALLGATSRELISALNLASSQAITVNRPHRLCVDVREGRYWLEVLAEDGSGQSRYQPVPRLDIGAQIGEDRGVLDERIRVEVEDLRLDPQQLAALGPRPPTAAREGGAVELIYFRPDGTADGRRIVLRDRAGFGLEILILPSTSRIEARRLRVAPG